MRPLNGVSVHTQGELSGASVNLFCPVSVIHVDDVREVLAAPYDWMSEVRAREAACLPGSEAGA